MNKRAIAILLILCFAFFLTPVYSAADDPVYFTAVNDSLLPLGDSTMPRYCDGFLCVPHTVFTASGLNVTYSRNFSGNMAYLESGSETLAFYIGNGTVSNKYGTVYPASAVFIDDMLFVPVDFVCSAFGFSSDIISVGPAYVVRVTSGGESYGSSSFASAFEAQVQAEYNDYMGIVPEPSPVVSDNSSSSPEPSPSPSPIETYSDVTVYLSFDGVNENILDELDAYGYKGCFFLSKEDILENPDLVRRICCTGHGVGISLEEGTEQEYADTSALLYEAAKARTVLVLASESSDKLASGKGLSVFSPSVSFDGSFYSDYVNSSLSTTGGYSDNLLYKCSSESDGTLYNVLSYISEHKYYVDSATEINMPSAD